MDMLDLYSDYLIFQNKYATATGLADLLMLRTIAFKRELPQFIL